jgi:hypothetical protein
VQDLQRDVPPLAVDRGADRAVLVQFGAKPPVRISPVSPRARAA